MQRTVKHDANAIKTLIYFLIGMPTYLKNICIICIATSVKVIKKFNITCCILLKERNTRIHKSKNEWMHSKVIQAI